MPKKRKNERIVGTHFIWLLGQRDGVYYADGRSNRHAAGRHSLGTKNHAEALEELKKLDLGRAVELGLADRSLLASAPPHQLSLADGRRMYLEHVQRPRVVGGARPTSAKRYRAVLDKFVAFAQDEGVGSWNQVNHQILGAYAAHLDDEGYAYATSYLELTTLKQMIKWLVAEGHLPLASEIRLPLVKPQGTTTYCWHEAEVRAMVRHCRLHLELAWLGDVLTALACTGLRISELASLRWTDIDLSKNVITLTDESSQARRRTGRKARLTKSGRSRSFPIQTDLRPLLEAVTPAPDGLVFHGPRGGRLKPDTVRRLLVSEVLKPLGASFPTPQSEVGFVDGRLHSFRHFFCSACANKNVPEQVVMAWLGHRDSAMVRHYYHLHDDEAQRQMKRLNILSDAGDGVVASDVSEG